MTKPTEVLLPVQAEARELAKAAVPSDPIEAALLQIVQREVTPESVQAVRELCGLVREVRADKARQEYNQALAAFQMEIANVQATRTVPNDDGTIRYVFAPIEEIMEATREARIRHGFSISFAQDVAGPDRLVGICTLHHAGGHSESTRFTVRIGKGPPKTSEPQADAAAYTLASRYALLAALGLPVQKDTDARLEGAIISAQKAEYLKKRVEAEGIEIADFLRLAEAESFEEIREGKLPVLEQVLREKSNPLDVLKRSWAKAKYGSKRPDRDTMRKDFRVWVESILQKTVQDVGGLSLADLDKCTTWLKGHGAVIREQQ